MLSAKNTNTGLKRTSIPCKHLVLSKQPSEGTMNAMHPVDLRSAIAMPPSPSSKWIAKWIVHAKQPINEASLAESLWLPQ